MTAILLGTYNGSKYLRELLDSLFAQTNQEFKLVVHDDGSTDKTCEILAEYAADHKGRVEILWGPPTGSPQANFMWMLSQVNADYYLYCDQDDVWMENKLELTLSALQELEGDGIPALVFSDMDVVDERLNLINSSFIRSLGRDVRNTAYTQVLIDNPAAGCTEIFNRALRDIVVQFPDVDSLPMHDVWTLLMADIFGRVKGLDVSLVRYRQTGHNIKGASEETDKDKVSRNAKDLKNGSFIEKKKAFIKEARDLAELVLLVDKLPAKVRTLLKEFVNIDKKNKFERIVFYKKNKFERARRTWWMYLWL